MPFERCRPIEEYTEGAVTCEELRPDLVEEFAYMRHRPEPEMQGQVVVQAGDALGYNGLNDKVKAVVMGCDIKPQGLVCTEFTAEQLGRLD